MNIKHGKEVRPPKGFHDTLFVQSGRKLKVRYFLSIREGKIKLDGRLWADKDQLWVATWGRSVATMADTILHEVFHWNQFYHRTGHGEDLLTEDTEESLALTQESGNATLLRSNPWFTKLYLREEE